MRPSWPATGARRTPRDAASPPTSTTKPAASDAMPASLQPRSTPKRPRGELRQMLDQRCACRTSRLLREIDRRLAVLVCSEGVRPPGHEQGNDHLVATRGCVHQRTACGSGGQLDIGPMPQQTFHDILAFPSHRPRQRGPAEVAHVVRIGAFREHLLDLGQVSRRTRDHEFASAMPFDRRRRRRRGDRRGFHNLQFLFHRCT